MKKLLVLVVNDMVIFPNNEVRIEYDNTYDQAMIDLVNHIDDNKKVIDRDEIIEYAKVMVVLHNTNV